AHASRDPSSTAGGAKLAPAQRPRQLIEHGIDHTDLFLVHEGVGDVDILRNDDPRRDIALVLELIDSRSQHRAQDRFDTLEWPARGQRGVDARIGITLLGHEPLYQFAEE